MTFKRVPIYNVTIEQIRDVLNDLNLPSYSKTRNISGAPVFTSPNIHADYIDPNWCDGNTNETRQIELSTTKPISFYDYLNYGGEEGEPVIPEIYFSSIIGKGFSSDFGNIECLPTTPEGLQFLLDGGDPENPIELIPAIIIPPDLTIADTYISESITESRMLVDSMQSPMLRKGADNALNISDLGVKVGLDYPNGEATRNAKFAYKISLSYGDLPREMPVTVIENIGGTNTLVVKLKKLWFLIPIGAGGIIAYNLPDIIAAIRNDRFWDYMRGHLQKTWTHIKDAFKWLGDKAKSIIDSGSTLIDKYWLADILAELAVITVIVLTIERIYSWSQVNIASRVKEGIYQYKNMVEGMYTFNDIKDTKYQIGFGKLYVGTDDFVSNFISTDETLHEHIVPLNASIFPADDEETTILTHKNYANFKFFPKCTQYDLMTPPPVITFTIELVAIENCVLSSTKPTAFTVSIAPDKYSVPIFDIITPSGRASVMKRDVYINSHLIFENVKFVDFIALLDLDINGFFSFDHYRNRYINTDGNQGQGNNRYFPVYTNNIECSGGEAFQGIGYPEPSNYDALFMQEAQGNLLYNPTFRLERLSDNPDSDTYILKKYWNYDSSWQIRDGAIYRDNSSNLVDGIWQSVPKLKQPLHTSVGQFYFIEIEFTAISGTLSIDLLGTFDGGICDWLNSDIYYGGIRSFLRLEDYPSGVTLDEGLDRLILTGSNNTTRYKLMVKVGYITAKIFRIIPSEDYTGMIKYVSLQYIPNDKLSRAPVISFDSIIPEFGVDVSTRNAVNVITEYGQKRLQLRWMGGYLSSKTITLIFAIIEPTTVHIKFTPNENEVSNYTTTITWKGNSIDTLNDMSYQEYDIQHTFLFSGDYTVTIKNSMSELNTESLILFETFTCNDIHLLSYKDPSGLMANGSVDLSNSGIDKVIAYPPFLDNFGTPLYSLNINNTLVRGNCDNLVVVTDYLDISHTPITGDLSSLFNIAHVNASYTDIKTSFASSIIGGNNGDKTIIWKNCGMNVQQLYNLIHSIDLSNIESTTNICLLDIKGNNPPITDQDMLDTIFMLKDQLPPDSTGREWNVLYNSIEATFDKDIATLIYNEALDQYELTIDYQLFINQYDETSVLYFDVYDETGNFLETVSRAFTSETPNVWTIPVDYLEDVYVFSPIRHTLTITGGTGSGNIKEGLAVEVSATIPSEYYFNNWTGDTSTITTGSTTDEAITITMGTADISLTANFLPYLDLTVNGGTIS